LSRSAVAASSRPKQQIVSRLKQKEKDAAGKPYKPSKRGAMEVKNINWKTPSFWPFINQVVTEHNKRVGKPKLSEVLKDLQNRDMRFKYLTHQRLSDWRDKANLDKIVWSKKTLAEVQKGFLPGGDQTHFSVFVSFHI
jgi:hypothetical protein